MSHQTERQRKQRERVARIVLAGGLREGEFTTLDPKVLADLRARQKVEREQDQARETQTQKVEQDRLAFEQRQRDIERLEATARGQIRDGTSRTRRFVAGVPTLGGLRQQLIEEDISRQEAEFRALTPEQVRARALGGTPGFVGESRPFGEVITFTPQVTDPGFRETQRIARERGEFAQRTGGSILLGGLRFGAETTQLGIEALSGGQPGQRVPTPEFVSAVRAQPSDPVQFVSSLAIPVGGVGAGAVRFVRTRRAVGTARALEEGLEAFAPVRVRTGTRFVPRGQPTEVFTFRETGTPSRVSQVGLGREGEIVALGRGTIRPTAGREEIFAGEQFTLGRRVDISTRGGIQIRPEVIRQPFREIVSPAPVEVPLAREPFGISAPARGFISGEFAGATRQVTPTFARGVAGRRVRPVTEAEAGFIPEIGLRGFVIQPTQGFGIRGLGRGRRPSRSLGLEQELVSVEPIALPPGRRTVEATRFVPTSGIDFQSIFGTGQISAPRILETEIIRRPGQPLTLFRPRQRDVLIPSATRPRIPVLDLGRERIVPRQAPTVIEGLAIIPAQAQIPRQLQAPGQALTLDSVITAPPTALRAFDFPPIRPRGAIGFPLTLPGFGLGTGLGQLPIGRQIFRRQPSFAAVFFDIREARPRRFEETGLVLRPILR